MRSPNRDKSTQPQIDVIAKRHGQAPAHITWPASRAFPSPFSGPQCASALEYCKRFERIHSTLLFIFGIIVVSRFAQQEHLVVSVSVPVLTHLSLSLSLSVTFKLLRSLFEMGSAARIVMGVLAASGV